jgi:hypothetical protein
MRPEVRHVIMNRMKNDHRDMNDFADMARGTIDRTDVTYDKAYKDGYDNGYEDGRRGVKGSGRRRRDMDDFDDEEDFGKPLRLPRKVREHWLRNLKDIHGNKGPRFDKDEIMDIADKMKIDYDDYTPADLYLMTNVLYSDCTVFRQLTPKEKEAYYWVAAAKEWLEDDDASLTGSERVVSYYYNVANG